MVWDQLEQGVRVLDLEITAVDPRYACPVAGGPDAACNATAPRCRLHRGAGPLGGSCLACCPFVVSHGTDFESIFLRLGFTFLETLLEQVRAWTEAHPREVVSLLGLLNVHDGSGGAVRVEDVMQRLGTAGLLPRVWNHDASRPFDGAAFPTLGAMRAAGRTVMLLGFGADFAPQIEVGCFNASGLMADGSGDGACVGGTPCVEGWDTVTFEQLAPARAILRSAAPYPRATLFALPNLSSRRGRADASFGYWPLPHLLEDAPYLAEAHPAQAARAADAAHVLALEAAFTGLLARQRAGQHVNLILVDFFNTTAPGATWAAGSLALRPNPEEGLISAVARVNAARSRQYPGGWG